MPQHVAEVLARVGVVVGSGVGAGVVMGCGVVVGSGVARSEELSAW